MSASEPPDQLADRRRELQAALDALQGEPSDHPEQLDRVFAAADGCLDVVNVIESGTARRLRWVAYGLLVVAVLPAVLVVFHVFPPVVLLGTLVVLVAAIGLLVVTRNTPETRS